MFTKIKRRLSATRIRAHPNLRCLFVFYTDALQIADGAIFLKLNLNGIK